MLLEYPCAMRRKTYYRRGEGGLMYNHAVIVAIVFFVFTNVISAAPTFETSLPQSHSNEIAEYFSEINGCYYNFQRYEEGDRIVTNEPCLNCTCHNRMLMCYLRVCPFTKAIGQDCTIEKKPDQCCPIITCPEVPVKLLTSSTTSSPAPVTSTTEIGFRDNYGCTINNIFYTDGAQVPSDVNKPCELCYCIRNRTACVMQECTLHVEGCSPVFKPGVCCPVKYECDYDKEYTSSIRPQTTGGLLKSTTLSPVGDCFYGNHYFSDGELIKTEKPCEHCYCMRGDIVCAVQDCGEPLRGKDCIPTTPPPNKCCPSSYACANETASIEDITKASDIAGTTFTQPDDTFSSFDTTTSRYKNTPVVLSQEEVYERLGEKKTPTTTLLPEKIFTTLSSLSSKHPSEDIQLDDESVDADEHVPQPGTTNEPLKEHVTEKDANDDKTTTRRIQSETITPGVSLPKASQGVTITPSQYEATTEILTKVGDENTTKEEFTKSPLDESPDNAVSATEITTEKIKYETTKYAEKVDTTKYNERENTSEKLTTKPIVGNQEQVTVTEKLPSADAVTDEKNSDETTTPIFLYSKFPTDFNRPSSEEPQDENSSEPIKFQLTTRQFDKNSVLSKEQETTTASEESLQPNTKIPPSNTELPVEHQTENMNTLSNESTASLLANITKIVNSVQNSQKIPPYQIPMTETTKAPIADDETTTRKDDYPITEKTAEILTTIKNEVGTVVPSVIPGEGSCLVDGITYPNTSIIESYNPCHSKCVCLSSIPTCTLITCAPPPANPNCMPIQMKPESCCPVYICNDNKEQPSGEVPSSHNQIVLDEPEDVNHFPQEDETTTIVGEHDFSTKVADLNKSTPETITEKSKPENDVSVNKLETTTIAISKPENEVEKKPENDAESKPENVVENKPENDAENKPENDAENKPENDAESKPENDAESKPENVAENKPENDAENKPENDAESKPENDAENKPENDAENKPQNDNVENEHENVNTIENKIDSTTISADKSQNGDAGSQNVADHVTETGSTVSSIADETYKPNIVTTNEQTIQDKIDEPITTTDTPTTVKESIVEESSVENNDLPQVTTVKGVDVKIGFPESPVTVADASESSEKPSSYQGDSSSGNEVHNDENSTSGYESYPTTSQEHLSENSATTKPTTSEKYNDISSSENNSPYQDKETTEFEKIITTEDTLVHLTSISTEPKDEAQKYSTEIPSTEPNPTVYVNEKIDINPTTLPEKITEINPTTLYEKINVNPTTLPPKSPYEQNDAASDSNSPNIAQNNFEASQNPEESITTTEVPAADFPSVTTIAAHSSVSDAESDNEQNDITTKLYELFSSTETQTSEPIKHSEFESITTAKDDLSNEISPVETTTAVHILNEKISTDGESSSIPEVTSGANEYTSEPYSSSFPTTEKGVELDVTEKLSHEQGQLAGSYNPPVTTNESDTVPVETTEPYIVNEPYQTSYPPSYDSETTVHYNSESEKHTGSGIAVTSGPSSNIVTTNSPDDEGIKEHEDDVKPITILPETNDYPSVTVLPSKTTYSTLPQTFQSENIQTEITPEDHSQNGLPLNETHDDETTQKVEPPITEHSEPLVTEIASAEQTYPPSTKKYVNLTDSQSTPQYVETSSVTPTPIQHSTWTRKPIEEETSEPNYYPPVPMYPTGGGATGTDSGSEESEYDEGSAFGTGTCRYGGKIYVSAQQIPREDPCDFCFCFRSDIICLQQSCPPPIQGCRQETISGFCCPRYECPVASALAYNASTTTSTTTTSTTTTTQPHFTLESYRSHARKVGCMIHGYFYKVGDDIAIASGPCLECICGSDGRMKCDPKSCSPEPFVRSFIGEAMSKR